MAIITVNTTTPSGRTFRDRHFYSPRLKGTFFQEILQFPIDGKGDGYIISTEQLSLPSDSAET